MKNIKRLMCALLSLALLLGTTGLAEAAVVAAADAASPVVYTHNGSVTMIDGSCAEGPVNSFDDAYAVVGDVLEELGGDEKTTLVSWRELTDAYGNRYYVFQQMYDNTTVLGGAVKVITDAGGNMLGLTSSIVSDLPDTDPAEGITAEAAQQIVLDYAQETRQQSLSVMDGLTSRMILPVLLSVQMDAEEDERSRYVWVVYTDNPDSSLAKSSDLPYLAHYVSLSGEYLYSLPTIIPGDEAGSSGFDASYVFEFMEPVDYTGYVDLSSGEEMEISVSVMRDKRTGMYYLGNLERRIVVADCWEFLYNDNRVVLESSPDNLEWDQVGLLTLYNYCRAYDYYKAIGWIGGDGLGTPIMVLNNYCDENHQPVDNAAYVGGYLGWQLFLASQANDFSQCLDVLAHEFTHCVTSSVMTYNAYMNDYGAINEAMSDIQGKTCEMMMDGAENSSWVMGDHSKSPVRDMADPHNYHQPEFSWDLYYMPNVKTPTTLNDEGGVHSNSSLLNAVAWRLYEKAGMTLEEGRAFWFTVDCAMVPGTDYAQLSELLPWALGIAGLEKYTDELRRALDATRLGVKDIPDTFDEDRALLALDLPDNETFNDEQWVLMTFGVNADRLISEGMIIFSHLLVGDYSSFPASIQKLLTEGDELFALPGNENKIDFFLDILFAGGEVDEREMTEEKKEMFAMLTELLDQETMDWLKEHFGDVFFWADTNGGQDGHTMRAMSRPGSVLPVLVHGIWNDSTSQLDDTYIVVYLGGQWFDLMALFPEETASDGLSPEMTAMIDGMIEKIDDISFKGLGTISDILDLVLYRVDGGMMNILPVTGLDTLQPEKCDLFDDFDLSDSKPAERRMSRPKLDDEVSEAA